jgi:RNA polymerase sigma factor (TIGR02999 family)
MSDVTLLLNAAVKGDRQAAADLLPQVYEELRRLAGARMSHEATGHTLNATGLVHEAYLRLVGDADTPKWAGRAHFFTVAAEMMRRILIDHARRKRRERHGGQFKRVELTDHLSAGAASHDDKLLAVNDVVDQLAAHDESAAHLVKLHVFAGMTLEQAADALGISDRTAYRDWKYARAWMFRKLRTE